MTRFGVLLILFQLAVPAESRAGAAYGGMGGVGIGIADPSGDLSDNPAATAADFRGEEGAARTGLSWERLSFAGSAYNRKVSTVSAFPLMRDLGWSFVTPSLASDGGRIGFGAWQVDGRGLEVNEALDTSLAPRPSQPALSGSYSYGTVRIRESESLDVVGAAWIQPFGARLSQFAVGAGYASLSSHGSVYVTAVEPVFQREEFIHQSVSRRSLTGPVALAGFFYRPLKEGSLGIGIMYAGEMRGDVWEQTAGGPIYHDTLGRPAQLRLGLGGSFTIFQGLTAAVDLKFVGESRPPAKTLFAGTGAARSSSEYADASFSLRAGLEYRLLFWDFDIPVRAGFFSDPDPLPAPTAGLGAASVSDFRPVPFKQDVTGVTFGTGWSSRGLRADLAVMWLMVTTHVKVQGAAGTVDSGDVRSSLGAVGSVALLFKKTPLE